MGLFIKIYLITLIVFFSIDFLWLGFIAAKLYREQLGFLMRDQIKWGPALLFYLLYVGGILFFSLIPALEQKSGLFALYSGALLGLICYATYDLTNLATLKDWPIKIVIYDLLWGTFLTGMTSLVSFWINSYLRKF